MLKTEPFSVKSARDRGESKDHRMKERRFVFGIFRKKIP